MQNAGDERTFADDAIFFSQSCSGQQNSRCTHPVTIIAKELLVATTGETLQMTHEWRTTHLRTQIWWPLYLCVYIWKYSICGVHGWLLHPVFHISADRHHYGLSRSKITFRLLGVKVAWYQSGEVCESLHVRRNNEIDYNARRPSSLQELYIGLETKKSAYGRIWSDQPHFTTRIAVHTFAPALFVLAIRKEGIWWPSNKYHPETSRSCRTSKRYSFSK